MKRNSNSVNSENGRRFSVQHTKTFAEKYLAGNQENTSVPNMKDHSGERSFTQAHDSFQGSELGPQTRSVSEPGFIHSEMNFESGQQENFILKWDFFDLKSRKQTGDLYKKILSYRKKSSHRTFCFTSSTSKEGVTTILTNLANYIRNQGNQHHVLLIDANLGSPGMNQVFGIPAHRPGLIEVLERKIDLESVLVSVGDNMSVLCSGNVEKFRRNSINPEEFFKLTQACKTFADYLLVDCPPVLVSSDVFSVAPASDITFLVVQAVKVRRQVAEKGINELRNNECEIGGIIMNRVQQVIPGWVYRFI